VFFTFLPPPLNILLLELVIYGDFYLVEPVLINFTAMGSINQKYNHCSKKRNMFNTSFAMRDKQTDIKEGDRPNKPEGWKEGCHSQVFICSYYSVRSNILWDSGMKIRVNKTANHFVQEI